ncbi:hypothetical protein C8R43DRAFT_946859 [Mycena crocata]|nr:hypothetical protein C8R43DRAFT_946859 [Mycena crocata]
MWGDGDGRRTGMREDEGESQKIKEPNIRLKQVTNNQLALFIAKRGKKKARERRRIAKEDRKNLRNWAEGVREELLKSRLADYADVLARGWRDEREALALMCNEFHARICWCLVDHRVTASARDRIEELDLRIRRWLKYRARRLNKKFCSKLDGSDSAWGVLLSQLSNNGPGAPPTNSSGATSAPPGNSGAATSSMESQTIPLAPVSCAALSLLPAAMPVASLTIAVPEKAPEWLHEVVPWLLERNLGFAGGSAGAFFQWWDSLQPEWRTRGHDNEWACGRDVAYGAPDAWGVGRAGPEWMPQHCRLSVHMGNTRGADSGAEITVGESGLGRGLDARGVGALLSHLDQRHATLNRMECDRGKIPRFLHIDSSKNRCKAMDHRNEGDGRQGEWGGISRRIVGGVQGGWWVRMDSTDVVWDKSPHVGSRICSGGGQDSLKRAGGSARGIDGGAGIREAHLSEEITTDSQWTIGSRTARARAGGALPGSDTRASTAPGGAVSASLDGREREGDRRGGGGGGGSQGGWDIAVIDMEFVLSGLLWSGELKAQAKKTGKEKKGGVRREGKRKRIDVAEEEEQEQEEVLHS